LDSRFSSTPEPPYYAVILTSQASEDQRGYAEMSVQMTTLALAQDGCLGAESTRDESGLGITVSYWDTQESISQWKANLQHAAAQRSGIARWYSHYELRVAKVERAYSGPARRYID